MVKGFQETQCNLSREAITEEQIRDFNTKEPIGEFVTGESIEDKEPIGNSDIDKPIRNCDTDGPIRDCDKEEPIEDTDTDNPGRNLQKSPKREPQTPYNSRRLVRALINKRDYLRAQVRNFQQNFSGFRFIRRKAASREDVHQAVTSCSDEDLKEFVAVETIDPDNQDGCHDEMAVKRSLDQQSLGGAVTHEGSMEGGGGQYIQGDQKWEESGPKKSSSGSRSITEGTTWSALMSALSPTSTTSREAFQGEHLPEMSKSDDDAFIDDLPLGSEGTTYCRANTISPVVTTESSLPALPQDARLAQLRGTGTPVWSSFHSEVSAQTSGSSANSLDNLLSQRNVDPVHMLRSLGFDYIHEQVPPMLRVPQRFIKESRAKGIDIDSYLEEYPELRRKLKKSGWRGLSKSISTCALMRKTNVDHRRLAEPFQGIQEANNHNFNNNNNTIFNNNNSSSTGSNLVIDDEVFPRSQSILIPENQRALAEQGYYDRKDQVTGKVDKQEAVKDAKSKRAQFRGTKRWSLVDDFNEELPGSMDLSQSLDEPRGRSSTGFSSSMDSSESHITDSSNSETYRQLEEEIRKVCRLRPPEDEDFGVTPTASKQNTIEKAVTLTEEDKEEGKHVRIVVSEAVAGKQAEDQTDAPKSPVHTFLTIVNTQLDRLSDSGSDHTLVDTPRFSGDADPSRPPLAPTISKDSVFEESERMEKVSVSCQTSIDSGQLDENDNRSSRKRTNGKNTPEDLPRMASVQSDSSGFGDADNTVDIAPEIEKSLMSSLGSSSESAGTLASSYTAILMPDDASDMATQTSTSEQESNTLVIPSIRLPSDCERANRTDTARSRSETSRYITTVYIPEVNRMPASPTIVKQDSDSVVSGKGVVLGRHRVSLVVPNHSQSSSEDPDQSLEQKSHWVIRKNVKPVKILRAPLAQPEEYDSDEARANNYPPSKRQVSELNLRVVDSPYGSQISLADEGSDYSSVADSTASCSTSEILDYRKLIRLINHPVSHRGRKQPIIRYRPKKHIRDWPSLIRKKRIQEETRLLQHALHKYKTDLHSLETSCLLQYQLAYEDLTDEEREEVEELQGLWTEVLKQVQTMEQLLSHRMKSVSKGNDFFTFLSSLNVIHRMTELLKEQMYQQTVSSCLDQEQDEEEDEEEEFVTQSPFSMGSPYPQSPFSSSHLPDPSPSHSPSPSHMSGYGSPFGAPRTHQNLQHSMEEMRRSLMDEMKQELNRSTQQLHLDMQAKDNEIQRLNLEIMMQSRSPRRSKALYLRRGTKESDV